MSSIIAAIDFSDVTDNVVTAGILQAKNSGSKLYFIHIAEPNPDFLGFEAGPQFLRDQQSEHFHKEHLNLQAISAAAADKGCHSTALLLQGATVEVLLSQQEKLGANMIIVGSHSHSSIHNIIIGSTTTELLRKTPKSVLVVPATDK